MTGRVEHNLQEELAQSIVGVDAGPLEFVILVQIQQQGPQALLIQGGLQTLFFCEPAEALQRCTIGLSGLFGTPLKQKVLFSFCNTYTLIIFGKILLRNGLFLRKTIKIGRDRKGNNSCL